MNDIKFSDEDLKLIKHLIVEITGSQQFAENSNDIIIQNISRRMKFKRCSKIQEYLKYIASHQSEIDFLISAMTIHTTSWFRELPHYKSLESKLQSMGSSLIGKKIRFLSAACSTGEELYSAGCVLESFRQKYLGFDYELVGIDIDPLSLQKAQSAQYTIDDFQQIPRNYQSYFLLKANTKNKAYQIDPQIRKRTRFSSENLLENSELLKSSFDFIFCRNVLIYFNQMQVSQIITNLSQLLKADGQLTLGHSESISAKEFKLSGIGGSSYVHQEYALELMGLKEKQKAEIKLLIVDDSKMIRKWVIETLSEKPSIRCFEAESAEAASLLLQKSTYDIILLDLNMPGQNGISWLREQRHSGMRTPVILFTDMSTQDAPQILEALEGPAQDYFNKNSIRLTPDDFINRIENIAQSPHKSFHTLGSTHDLNSSKAESKPDLILIGASTGGTEALCSLLKNMPENSPPIVCIQHIPSEFSSAFYLNLSKKSSLKISQMNQDTELKNGFLYMPVGDYHLGIENRSGGIHFYKSYSEKLNTHRPSISFLFQSACLLTNKNVMAILLTGMGKDGSRALLDLKNSGAFTMIQDEASSVVWGMPGEASKLGAAIYTGNIQQLRQVILDSIRISQNKKTVNF